MFCIFDLISFNALMMMAKYFLFFSFLIIIVPETNAQPNTWISLPDYTGASKIYMVRLTSLSS